MYYFLLNIQCQISYLRNQYRILQIRVFMNYFPSSFPKDLSVQNFCNRLGRFLCHVNAQLRKRGYSLPRLGMSRRAIDICICSTASLFRVCRLRLSPHHASFFLPNHPSSLPSPSSRDLHLGQKFHPRET